MRMRAAVLSGPGQSFSVEEVELDPPKAGEVLVKLVATGVCHSDVHYYTGDLYRASRPWPVVLGHEGAGIVEEVGPGVTSVKPGDHVIFTFLPSCGRCKWCHIGQPNLCDLGRHIATGRMADGTSRLHRLDGTALSTFSFISTWAEYSVCPEASLVPVADWLPLHKLCLLGCGFTTGYGAATNAAHVRPGETALVVGCGGLGLSAIQGLRASGAGKIIAVDLHPEKLEMAKTFGATHTLVNPHDPDAVVKEVMDITWGVGTDFSFEFVGFDQTNETIDIAFRGLRKGGTMFMVGVGSVRLNSVPIQPYVLTNWRKRVQGVLFGDAQFRSDIPRYIQLWEEGRIDLDHLITREMRLEDIDTAVQNVVAGNKVGRQVIRFD